MARTKTTFVCSDCGHQAGKWIGQCPDCQAWNTHEEELVEKTAAAPVVIGEAPRRITEIEATKWAATPTGVQELDRVLGGGFVSGSVTLVGGEPGIGKSTLLLQAAAEIARAGRTCLYVSAEESSEQVRLRAERLQAIVPELWLVGETSLPAVLQHCDELKPDFVVVDSIQTIHDPELRSAPGSVGQVRHCAHRLVSEAKRRCMTTVLVGHVTKEGGLAGPRVLEHVVDTVLAFEGDRHHALRLLRAAKHRFGATDELGVFEMKGEGLRSVDDPSELFLADRATGVAGSVVVPALDGHRPLLILGLALALASSFTNLWLEPGLVACGEIGLAGELRQSAQTERRLAEAARVGFTKAIIPAASPEAPPGIQAIRAETLVEALDFAGLLQPMAPPSSSSLSSFDPHEQHGFETGLHLVSSTDR